MVTNVIEELRASDWSMPFMPQAEALKTEWHYKAQFQEVEQPELVCMREEWEGIESRHLNWELHLRVFLHRCRNYLNDCGRPEDMRRFESSGLILIVHGDDSLSRVSYLKDQCLADLQSLADLLSRKPKVKAAKKSGFARGLKEARIKHEHSQKQMAAATGLKQPEISMFERGKRKPKGANLGICVSYMQEVHIEVPSD